MKAIGTTLPEVFILEPTVYGDERGFFFECFNARRFEELVGWSGSFVQDNHSRSRKNVLRGLHYQIKQPQGKLVRVVCGEVFDVAVDLRRRSPRFGQWTGTPLSAENRRMLWIPPGFGHGFLVTSTHCDFLYKTTDYWAVEHERCIAWNDPDLAIPWPCDGDPIVSEKDAKAVRFAQAEVYP